MIDEKELNKMSLYRLIILNKYEIKNLDHYLIRDDLYSKNDILKIIEEMLIINTIMQKKVKKYKHEKTKK